MEWDCDVRVHSIRPRVCLSYFAEVKMFLYGVDHWSYTNALIDSALDLKQIWEYFVPTCQYHNIKIDALHLVFMRPSQVSAFCGWSYSNKVPTWPAGYKKPAKTSCWAPWICSVLVHMPVVPDLRENINLVQCCKGRTN